MVASYGCRELIELGVADILQPDINHMGGITAFGGTRPMARVFHPDGSVAEW